MRRTRHGVGMAYGHQGGIVWVVSRLTTRVDYRIRCGFCATGNTEAPQVESGRRLGGTLRSVA